MCHVTSAYTGTAMKVTSASVRLSDDMMARMAASRKKSGQNSCASAVKTGATWSL